MKLNGKKILLKLSGEALMGEQPFGIDTALLASIAKMIGELHDHGYQLAIVVGGGNIFRGVSVAAEGGDRVIGDHMGMLATIMNGLALGQALRQQDRRVEVLSALSVPAVCDTFTQRGAKKAMKDGAIVVLTAGTGNPFVTTDTGAALRAAELGCSAIVKATKVDGIYTSDPAKDDNAERYEELTFEKVLQDGLAVMDMAAITLARDANIPIIVCSMTKEHGVLGALNGTGTRTIVR